jgi:hypothetical protein
MRPNPLMPTLIAIVYLLSFFQHCVSQTPFFVARRPEYYILAAPASILKRIRRCPARRRV